MPKASMYRNILCPAKVNLILRVSEPLKNGYHPLETSMVPISFGDLMSLKVEESKELKISLRCEGLKVDSKNNLVVRAARAFSEKSKKLFKAEILLKKKTPIGAGLGGGSSDAAMVLRVLQKHFRNPLSKKTLSLLALQLGADVPFFLEAKPAWCTGFGEIMEPFSISSWPLVLVFPKQAVSTPWAYKELDQWRKRNRVRAQLLGRPLFSDIPELQNDFEEPVFSVFPKLREVRVSLAKAGAIACQMSGSGSAFFGLFLSQKLAREGQRKLRRMGHRAVLCHLMGGFENGQKPKSSLA